MLDATDDYFTKLLRNLDSQIESAETRTRRDNARKPERDEFWTQLLAIWCDIGGKPHGWGGELSDRCVRASRRRREHQDGHEVAGSPERGQVSNGYAQHRRATQKRTTGSSVNHDKHARNFFVLGIADTEISDY